MAKQAFGQIETAWEVFRQIKHPFADFYEGEAKTAQALVAKLGGKAQPH